MAGVLVEDIFEVLVVDPEGKRFDKGKQLATHQAPKVSAPQVC